MMIDEDVWSPPDGEIDQMKNHVPDVHGDDSKDKIWRGRQEQPE